MFVLSFFQKLESLNVEVIYILYPAFLQGTLAGFGFRISEFDLGVAFFVKLGLDLLGISFLFSKL